MISYPVLLCEVGSEFSRFGSVRGPGEPVEILRRLRTPDFRDLSSAARQAIADASFDDDPLKPSSLLASVSGQVTGHDSILAASGWRVDGEKIAGRLSLECGLLLNNFEALALSLPACGPAWGIDICTKPEQMSDPANRPSRLVPPKNEPPKTADVQIVIGTGRQLGCAALVSTGRRYVAIPSAIADVRFGPSTDEEQQIWRHLAQFNSNRQTEQSSAGSILSETGLQRLHAARLDIQGVTATANNSASLIESALADKASEAAKTIRLYWQLLARFAGDAALSFSAYGGVTICGALARRILPLLDHTEFRAQFEANKPASLAMQTIGTRLLTREDALMHGLAAIAADPSRYAIDYANREWS